MGERFLKMAPPAKNRLDFYIVYYMGATNAEKWRKKWHKENEQREKDQAEQRLKQQCWQEETARLFEALRSDTRSVGRSQSASSTPKARSLASSAGSLPALEETKSAQTRMVRARSAAELSKSKQLVA